MEAGVENGIVVAQEARGEIMAIRAPAVSIQVEFGNILGVPLPAERFRNLDDFRSSLTKRPKSPSSNART